MPDQPLTRADFESRNDWLRYCHEGGLNPIPADAEFHGIQGNGYYERLYGAILGHTREEHDRAWLDAGDDEDAGDADPGRA